MTHLEILEAFNYFYLVSYLQAHVYFTFCSFSSGPISNRPIHRYCFVIVTDCGGGANYITDIPLDRSNLRKDHLSGSCRTQWRIPGLLTRIIQKFRFQSSARDKLFQQSGCYPTGIVLQSRK